MEWARNSNGSPPPSLRHGRQTASATAFEVPPQVPLPPSQAEGALRQWQQGWRPHGPAGGLNGPFLRPPAGGFPNVASFGSFGSPVDPAASAPPNGQFDIGRFGPPKVDEMRPVIPPSFSVAWTAPPEATSRPQVQRSRAASPPPRAASPPPPTFAAGPQMFTGAALVNPATSQNVLGPMMPPVPVSGGNWSPQTLGRPVFRQTAPAPDIMQQRVPSGVMHPKIAMPVSLLARIDGVVADMEKELADDNTNPLKSVQMSLGTAEGERTVDWLDKQIASIEQRREACEMRQTHLAELRRIVSEGKAWGLDAATGVEDDTAGHGQPRTVDELVTAEAPISVESSGRAKPGSHGRLTAIELDQQALREQVLKFEQRSALPPECSTEAVLERERSASLELEAQSLEERLRETEQTLHRERFLSEEAAKVQQTTEKDLCSLEEKSRDVLEDCRTLQATVFELEKERSASAQVQEASLRRIAELERELATVPEATARLAETEYALDRERCLRVEASEAHQTAESALCSLERKSREMIQDSKTLQATVAGLEAERVKMGEALAASTRTIEDLRQRELTTALPGTNMADSLRAQELQQQVNELQGLLTEATQRESKLRSECEQRRCELSLSEDLKRDAHESHTRLASSQKSRIIELEQQLADVEVVSAASTRSVQKLQKQVQDLEQESVTHEASAESHMRERSVHKSTIGELTRELEDLRLEKERHRQQQGAQQSTMSRLHEELEAAEGNQIRQHGVYKTRITELEQAQRELQDADAGHAKLHNAQVSRITSLEEQVEEMANLKQELAAKHALAEQLTGKHSASEMQLENALQELGKLKLELLEQSARSVRRSDTNNIVPPSSYPATLPGLEPTVPGLEPMQPLRLTNEAREATYDDQPIYHTVAKYRPISKETSKPQSSDYAVGQAWNAVSQVLPKLERARELHRKSMDVVLSSLSSTAKGQMQYADLIKAAAFEGSMELQNERQLLKQELETSREDLTKFKAQLTDRDLPEQDKEDVLWLLSTCLQRCEHDIEVLQTLHSLDDLENNILDILVKLYEAAARDHQDPISEFQSTDFSLLHWAVQHGKADVVEYLLSLKGGAALLPVRDKHGRTALYYATSSGNHALAQLLVEHGADLAVHDQQQRPSVSSLPVNMVEVLETIEKHGWHSVNFKGNFTLLHWSAKRGEPDLCAYLMNLNADPNLKDSDGQTPIELARLHHHEKALGMMQERQNLIQETISHHHFRYQPRRASKDSSTSRPASRRASRDLNTEGIPEAYKKVIDQIDEMGWEKMKWARNFSLLHWAAKNDRPDLCEHFMFCGADPNQQDENGKSAYDYATEFNSSSALQVLRRGAPNTKPTLRDLRISLRQRASMLVEATCSESNGRLSHSLEESF